jgi:MFS superfamily sulfate permease-like transporter
MSEEEAMSSPFNVLNLLFESFNVITLILTVVLLVLMFLLRKKLAKIPLIGIMVIIGVLANMQHQFKSYSDICALEEVDCKFYVVDTRNLQEPVLS